MTKITLSIILTFLLTIEIYSQCGCMSSMASGLLSPSTVSQAGNLREGVVLLNFQTNYTIGNKEYSSTRVVPNTTVLEFWNSSVSFKASYGVTKRLTCAVGANYIFQNNIKTYSIIKTYIFNYKTHGWNSAQLGAKYNLLFNPKNNYEITALADLFIPFQSVDDATYFYLQPTTGAIAYSLGLFFHKGFSDYEFDLFSSWSSTFNSKNSANYQFGSVHSLTVALTKPIIRQISVGLAGNFSYKDKDKLQEVVQANSGYKNLIISPQISFFFADFMAGLNADLPVYNEYFGSQMSRAFSVSLNLQYKFDTY